MLEYAAQPSQVEADGFTVQDWLAWEGSGDFRVELIDGALVVSPAPATRHQRVVNRLNAALRTALEDAGLTAELSGSGVISSGMRPEQGLIPDLMVVPASLDDAEDLPVLQARDVVLAIEVLSPSSRRRDRFAKLEIYAGMGIRHYWIVDPRAPLTITILCLRDGAYREVASASGEEKLVVDEPFRVTLVPRSLGGRRSQG